MSDGRQDRESFSSAAIRTPWGDLPIEARRASQCWWGEAWPSGVCYREDGSLDEAMRKPVPVGTECMGCGETIQEGDRGKTCGAIPGDDGIVRPAEWHRECLLANTVGPPVSRYRSQREMTLRQEALAVWEYWTARGKVTP